MNKFFEAYGEFLTTAIQHDAAVFSQAWLYKWLCIPAAAYSVFFLLKWMIITAPITMPIKFICSTIKDTIKKPKQTETVE